MILTLAIGLGMGCTEESSSVDKSDAGSLQGEADVQADGASPTDGGASDAGPSDATPSGEARKDGSSPNQPNQRTISDYRRCFSDIDCPVGLGSCVTEVALNRADADGTQSVSIDEIFETLEQGEGVCTYVCTNNPDVCATLSVNGNTPDSAEHVCQLVVEGESPYPALAPSFPFDDTLDPAAQDAGQAFGAICRPPFELAPSVDADFCQACEGPDSCGADSTCWSLLSEAPAIDGEGGTCLSTCDADDACALGFVCDIQDAEGQGYCRPTLDTCTACRDLDGDGFGTGRCGDEAQPVTPHDCDDRNPLAYFDPDNMDHAFPAYCGSHDYNCNGIGDDVEQIGAEKYPVEHCTSCYDVCQGEVENGQSACRNQGDLENPAPACVAQCQRDEDGKMLFADCDGDISNGCEVPTDDVSRQYYRDIDGDGYGDPNDVIFACDPNVVPDGYVDNDLDCDDSSSAAHGGPDAPAEICDGLDNDCNGLVDDGLDQVGQSCDTGLEGVCSVGRWECKGSEGFECVPDILPGELTEVCDGQDNNCNGEVDEEWPQDGTSPASDSGYTAYYVDADGDGYADENATTPRYACSKPDGYAEDKTDCNDNDAQINPGASEVCDGIDNNCNGYIDDNDSGVTGTTTFYKDNDRDGYGSNAPGAETINACEAPSIYWATRRGDCNDNDNAVNPGANDNMCNNEDTNCDGTEDSSFPDKNSSCYEGVGECRTRGHKICDPTDSSKLTCYVANQPAPEQEVCDSLDNNCSGTADEGCPQLSGRITTKGYTRNASGYGETDKATVIDYPVECPAGTVLVGVKVKERIKHGNAGLPYYVDLRCAPLGIDYDYHSGKRNFRSEARAYTRTTVEGVGFRDDPGTALKYYNCGSDSAIYKMKLAFNADHVLGLETTCRNYKINTSGGFSGVTSEIEGNHDTSTKGPDSMNHRSTHGPYWCRDNEVAVGFVMSGQHRDRGENRGENGLTKLELLCKELTFDTIQ